MNIEKEIKEWLKNIAYNYNHDIETNLYLELLNLSKHFGLDMRRIDEKYQHYSPGEKTTEKELYSLLKDQIEEVE